MVQLFGEKKKSELFPLKKQSKDNEESDDSDKEEDEKNNKKGGGKEDEQDVYTTTDSDLGKVCSIFSPSNLSHFTLKY